ncbi:MAG TPA: hypothetical protein VF540_01490, partial [Segetibacter sp.]
MNGFKAMVQKVVTAPDGTFFKCIITSGNGENVSRFYDRASIFLQRKMHLPEKLISFFRYNNGRRRLWKRVSKKRGCVTSERLIERLETL